MARANLSVIVTRYNKPPEQVEECINSIKEQTVQPLEVILVDDASDEPHSHAFATTIILPKNVGVAKARDIGARFSRGKLLLFLDADDKLSPDFIQQCGRLIANHDVVYTNFIMFGSIPKPLLIEPPEKIDSSIMLKQCPIRVTSMMWRRVYDGVGGFSDLPIFEDWDFWLKALCKGYTFGKANTYFMYRQNPVSRNRASSEDKDDAIQTITAPYELYKGRLRERKHGR